MAKSKKQRKKQAQYKKQEKQFFIWAIGLTLIALVICYIFLIK